MMRSDNKYELASPWKRLAAVFFNTCIFLMIFIFMSVFVSSSDEENIIFQILSIISILLLILLGIIQMVLLTIRGQSIGKIIMGVKIVKVNTYENGRFITNVLLRVIVNGLLRTIPLYGMVDILLIFSEKNRCIHDHIAGTIVVDLNKPIYVKTDTCENNNEEFIYNSEPIIYNNKKKSNKKNLLVIVIVSFFIILACAIGATQVTSWFHDMVEVAKEEKEKVEIPRIFTSDDGEYSILPSADWEKADPAVNEDASLILFSKDESKGFLVIRESREDFESNIVLEDYINLILNSKEENGTKIYRESLKEKNINVYKAQECVYESSEDGIKFKYLTTFIETPNNFYQIVAWTRKSSFNNCLEEFRHITDSFVEKFKGIDI